MKAAAYTHRKEESVMKSEYNIRPFYLFELTQRARGRKGDRAAAQRDRAARIAERRLPRTLRACERVARRGAGEIHIPIRNDDVSYALVDRLRAMGFEAHVRGKEYGKARVTRYGVYVIWITRSMGELKPLSCEPRAEQA